MARDGSAGETRTGRATVRAPTRANHSDGPGHAGVAVEHRPGAAEPPSIINLFLVKPRGYHVKIRLLISAVVTVEILQFDVHIVGTAHITINQSTA